MVRISFVQSFSGNCIPGPVYPDGLPLGKLPGISNLVPLSCTSAQHAAQWWHSLSA